VTSTREETAVSDPQTGDPKTRGTTDHDASVDGVDAGDVPGRASIPGATEGVDPDDIELRVSHD
jgi:hypothetical protein